MKEPNSPSNPGDRGARRRRSGRRSVARWDRGNKQGFRQAEHDFRRGHRKPSRIDVWRLADAFSRHAMWIVLGVCAAGLVAFNWAYRTGRSEAKARLVRVNVPVSGLSVLENAALGTSGTKTSLPSLVEFVRSTEILRRAGQSLVNPMQVAGFSRNLNVNAGADGDSIVVTFRGRSTAESVEAVNTVARLAVEMSLSQQQAELVEAEKFVAQRIETTDQEIRDANRRVLEGAGTAELAQGDASILTFVQQRAEFSRTEESLQSQINTVDLQIRKLGGELVKHNPALIKAKEELDRALLRFTEEHPKVKELRAAVAALREQTTSVLTNDQTEVNAPPNSAASSIYLRMVEFQTQRIGLERQIEETRRNARRLEEKLRDLPEAQVQSARVAAEQSSLKARREILARQLNEIHFKLQDATGALKIAEWARAENVQTSDKLRRAIVIGLGTGLLTALLCVLLVATREVADGRIRSERDLERAAGVPVLASLGDLREMSDSEREQWAFRTLTVLKGRLCADGTDAFVCGIVSAQHGEGRSTWVELLAQAARRVGHKVMVVSPPGAFPQEAGNTAATDETATPASTPALDVPAEVTRKLVLGEASPIMQVAVPDQVWDLEWRGRWQQAIQQWNDIPNLVLLVELPPASEPEAILLAEQIPQVIWLCEKDKATASETRSHMETLRCSKTRVAGAVLNRAATGGWRKRLAHLATMLCAAFWIGPWISVSAADNPETQPPHGSLSVSSPQRLADWQKRLTLGPGDVMNISLADEPDSGRADIAIGPDGRINYLDVQDLMASGSTVDELRDKINEALLSKGYRAPRAIIIPTAYGSKRYNMLGNVVRRGSYPLNRPTTLVEAVAQAGGLASTVQQRDTVLLADLSRSFIIRKAEDGTFGPVKVDLESLFLRGDLSQNEPLAPDDYLYFMPMDAPEVYVLGEVAGPGPAPHTDGATLIKALATRGGFTDRAWRRRVLVVRGSLNRPQTFVVNTADILAGKVPDFKLEPKDIVYVARRPWSRAEELLEAAIGDFARAVVVTWTGLNIGPMITRPIF